jgi:hypothetical protein
MKHTFKSNTSNPAICIKCSKDVVAHSEFATCEICKKFPCVVDIYEQVGDYAICDGCFASEVEAQLTNGSKKPLPEPIARIEADFVANKPVNGQRDYSLEDLPTNGTEFFNAETISHVKLHEKIMNDDTIPKDDKWVFYVQQLQARRSHLQTVLKEAVDILNETRSRLSSADRDINLVSSKLRADEKAKLKIADINYIPAAAPKKVAARTTEKNKVVINIAQIFCAPRDAKGNFIWNELTDEQREECLVKARQIFANNMSAINTATKVIESHDAGTNGEKK